MNNGGHRVQQVKPRRGCTARGDSIAVIGLSNLRWCVISRYRVVLFSVLGPANELHPYHAPIGRCPISWIQVLLPAATAERPMHFARDTACARDTHLPIQRISPALQFGSFYATAFAYRTFAIALVCGSYYIIISYCYTR